MSGEVFKEIRQRDMAVESEKRYIAQNMISGAWARVASLIASRGMSFARIMVFARIFTPDQMGTVGLTASIIGFLAIMGNLGFYQYVIKSKDEKAIADTSFTLSILFGAGILILTVASAPVLPWLFKVKSIDRYILLVSLLIFAIPMEFPKVFWDKNLKFTISVIPPLITEFANFALALLLELVFHLGLVSLLISQSLALCCSAWFIWSHSEHKPSLRLDLKQVRPLLVFGLPLMIQGLNDMVMSRGDNLLVAKFCGTEKLAFYNFAWQLPLIISSMATVIDGMLLPVYAKLDAKRIDIVNLFNLCTKMWAIFANLVGYPIILFSETIILVMFGEKWLPTVPILQLMMVSFIIRYSTGYSYQHIAIIRGRTLYLMKWGILNSLLVFTVCGFMIFRLGPIGGAWFWIVQAVVFNAFFRLPLIFQELKSLEFLKHIWQPLFSGGTAFLAVSLFKAAFHLERYTMLIAGSLIYCFVFILLLLILDSQLIANMKKLAQLAK